MAQQEYLILKNYVKDEETGYLRCSLAQARFQPEGKVKFLELFKETGNQTEAARLTGISNRILQTHLNSDKKFAEDFQAALMAMRHKLEEVMYQRALDPKGFIDRIAWLRAHYPEKYNPKSQLQEKGDKKAIDELWDSLNTDKNK